MANFKKYQKKNGQEAWQFSAYLGTDPKTGKRIKTTRRGFETKKQAQRACSQLLAEFDADTWAAMQEHSNTEPTTFKEVAELWLTSYKLTVQDSTYKGTVSSLKNSIYPLIGDKLIKEITRVDCQNAVNNWCLNFGSSNMIISRVKRIFKYAVALEIIDKNPMDSIIKPVKKSNHKPVKVYSKEQVNQILTYLHDNRSNYIEHCVYALFRVLFYTGLRIGEALALEWSDIDFKSKTINVDKTLKFVDNKIVAGKPKTRASIAVLPIDDQTLKILKGWHSYKRRKRLAIGLTEQAPIFSRIGGEYERKSYIYWKFKRLTFLARIPFHGIHITRHTHASLLIEAGANLKEVQTRLRHSSITMTMDVYGHLSKEYEASTLDKFVAFVSGSQNGGQ